MDTPFLLVEDRATGFARLMGLAEAAELTAIDPDEIAWALEAFGVCDSLDHVIRDTRPAVDVERAATRDERAA